MARKPITHNLHHPQKMQENSRGLHGLLSKLFWQVIMDLDITPQRYDRLMDQYVKDPNNGIPNTARDQTTERGNLNKAFCKSIISWKVMCKAIRFWRWKHITITLTATHWNNKVTHHSVEAYLGNYYGNQEENEAFENPSLNNRPGFDVDGHVINYNTQTPPWEKQQVEKQTAAPVQKVIGAHVKED